ncbi:MAG: apolipoprotein N-acyltransferase [Pseudomonadota bacterium]
MAETAAAQLPRRRLLSRPALTRLVSAASGALLSLAFAPLEWWPLAVLAPAVLLWLWMDTPSPREAALLGFCFSAGTFTAGTWWLYISIHVLGQAPVWVALLLMVALVAIMSAWQAGLGYVLARWLPRSAGLGCLAVMPAAWLLVEWWRGWFLSGFPWLSLGYSQTDSPLAGWAPLGGVYLLSGLLLVCAGALVALLRATGRVRVLSAALLVLPWPAGYFLDKVEWTRPAGKEISVAILQGAIPQDLKWLETNRDATLDLYAKLHGEALGAQLIVWPESAPPDYANFIAPYLGSMWSQARRAGSDVVIGVMRLADDGQTAYNSVIAMGDDTSFYDKAHLVPFGEYFPVPDFVRAVMRLMSLPHDDFTAGGGDQPPFAVAGIHLAPSICYEDAYASSLLPAMRQSSMLVNVTNDAWFGKSGARFQHLQISRMRTIESRRFMLRAANDGVSAIIGPRGEIVASAPQYTPAVLRGKALPRTGTTPYLDLGNWPVVLVSTAWVLFGGWLFRRNLGAAHRVYP